MKAYPISNEDDIKKIEDYLRSRNERNYMLFKIAINTGIDTSELVEKDIKYFRNSCKNGYIKLSNGKNIELESDLINEISTYIKDKTSNEKMFASRKKSEHISRQQIYRIFTEAAKNSGLDITIGSETLKKTFAYRYHSKHNDINELASILDKSTISGCVKYIEVKGV